MSFIADDVNNFKNQVYQLEQKWRSDRFIHTRRPYNADVIVSKRGTLKLEHAGAPLSRKLWEILNKIQIQGLGAVAFDTWNPSQVLTTSTQNLELAYISNQQAVTETHADPSSTVPSPATPLSTLPRKVDQILRSQVWFDRRQVELRHRLRSEVGLDSELPHSVDFHRPLVVDADLVGSNVPSLMRLSRMLIERGAAGIQLDDAQQSYSSILTQANLKVLYPVGQHINRLVALRAQSDIMDTETVIFTKLSSLQAGYVASNLDTRDHPYILGATVPTRPLGEVLREAQASGASTADQLNFIRNSWMNNANVLTYRDAIAQAIRLKAGQTPNQIQKEVEHWLESTRNTSLDHAKDLAAQMGLENVFWDWNLPRSQEGYYMYANTLEAAISRARHFAPYVDVVTLQSDAPDVNLADAFAVAVKKDRSHLLLGYSYPPLQSVDLSTNLYHVELANYVQQLANVGYAWQCLTLNPMNSSYVTKDPVAQDLLDRSIVSFATALRQKRSEKSGAPIHENLPEQQQYLQRLTSSLGGHPHQEEPALAIVDKAAADAQQEQDKDRITQLQDLHRPSSSFFGFGSSSKGAYRSSPGTFSGKNYDQQNQGRFNALNPNNPSSGQFNTFNPLNFSNPQNAFNSGFNQSNNFNPNLNAFNSNNFNPSYNQNFSNDTQRSGHGGISGWLKDKFSGSSDNYMSQQNFGSSFNPATSLGGIGSTNPQQFSSLSQNPSLGSQNFNNLFNSNPALNPNPQMNWNPSGSSFGPNAGIHSLNNPFTQGNPTGPLNQFNSSGVNPSLNPLGHPSGSLGSGFNPGFTGNIGSNLTSQPNSSMGPGFNTGFTGNIGSNPTGQLF